MIYVPEYNSGNCVVVRSEDVIRKYETTPTYNSNINYIDYYIHSDYIEQSGVQNFGSYASLPTCTPSSSITTDVQYRNDFDKILIIFAIIFLFSIYFPTKIVLSIYKKR